MNLEQFLKQSIGKLELAGIGTARLDMLVLLEDELKRDRSWLLAHLETPLQGPALQRLKILCSRRMKHEPLAYIRGKTEFYGRTFSINKHVLEPRPESEAMIEELKWLRRLPMRPLIADIGTGSGALAITAKLEIPSAHVLATDIDQKCLKVAERNAKKHKAQLTLHHGDLLHPLSTTCHQLSAILANLPYVPSRYRINQAAAQEPAHAIFGGGDGLELYRRFFGQLTAMYNKPRYILTESMPNQHPSLAGIAEAAGFKHLRTNDFIQVFESIY